MSPKEFEKWRESAQSELPEISARVFALRGSGYLGCGFHWGLEASLGGIINSICNYDIDYWYCDDALLKRMVAKVKYESLLKQLAEAEKTAKMTIEEKSEYMESKRKTV